ncbi:MAG: hypothetical protein AAFP84_00825 [Actinomycetota bacterium]
MSASDTRTTRSDDAGRSNVLPFDLDRRAGSMATTVGRTVTRTVTSTIPGTIADTATRSGVALADAVATPFADGLRSAARRLTEEPAGETDDWGRDAVLVRNVMFAARLRWDVSTGGDQRLPKRRGALVVVNSPRLSLAPLFTAFAISEAVDRPVRFVGRPDDDLIGAAARRLGGLLDHPDEVAGALRADELVVLGAATSRRPRQVGVVDHAIVGAALATGSRVFPAATTSHPFGRSARVEIGPAMRSPRHRRGPLGELELSDKLRVTIRSLLSEMGDIQTGTPLDWLPLSGMGSH